jgi:hypothetical protein
MPSRSALGQSFIGAMQVTQDFCLQKRSLSSGDVFPLDISGAENSDLFSRGFLLTESDVIFDASKWARH